MSYKVVKLVFDGYIGPGGSDMLVLVAMAEWCGDDGRCHPSIDSIAKKARLSHSQAQRVVRRLINAGWVTVIGNAAGGAPGSTCRYQLATERLATGSASATPTDRTDAAPTGSVDATGSASAAGSAHAADGSHGCGETGSAGATQTVIEPSENRQSTVGQVKPDRLPACPIQKIVDAYNALLPELPRAKVLAAKRERLIRSRWQWVLTDKRENGSRRATTADEALRWFGGFFERARENDFIMGRTACGAGHESWRADLDYLMSDKGLTQVVEKTGSAP